MTRGSRLVLSAALGLGLAMGCGSDDDKKVAPSGEAGGPTEGGAPGAGGGSEDAGGSAGEPAAGGQAGDGRGGAGASAGAFAGGQAGDGMGGAPGNECATVGSVTTMTVNTEPIYSGCRGGMLHVPFSAELASATFTCCGVSTSEPSFSLPVPGYFESHRGDLLELQVPEQAPFGTYAMQLTCPNATNELAFNVQINDGEPPVVLSVSAQVTPTGDMIVNGQNLDGVTAISAWRLSTGAFYQCLFDEQDQSATSITCSFDGNIPVSDDEQDTYVIDVYSDDCGAAADPPLFWVVEPPG